MRFRYVCGLLEQLESIELKHPEWPKHVSNRSKNDAITIWFKKHGGSIVNEHAALLSTLLPERRTDRVFGMQRYRFTRAMSGALGLGSDRARRLTGCPEHEDLSLLLEKLVKENFGGLDRSFGCGVAIVEVDGVLHDLAALQRWSSPKVRIDKPPSSAGIQRTILERIANRLSSTEMKWFVRILFKDLSSVDMYADHVLRSVSPLLPAIMKLRESFDDAVVLLNRAEVRAYLDEHPGNPESALPELLKKIIVPQPGSKVGRPDFLKARSFKHCAKMAGTRRWSIEPKYDGEYCQIHVDLSKGSEWIQIFSKSGKDSTNDRELVHDWVRQILRIDKDRAFQSKCILEGEMIVVDTRTNNILEFAKLRKYVKRSGSYLGTEQDSAPHEHEQLRIIFYDALMIDDDTLIQQPYITRRARLKQLFLDAHGNACRGSWSQVDFSLSSFCDQSAQEKALQRAFERCMAQKHEGLVLKPLDGAYLSLLPQHRNGYDGRIIKLKGDYIPGLGDTADFAVVGAFSSADHQVECKLLEQTIWTHFELACLINLDEVRNHQSRPRFMSIGSVSRPSISPEDMRYLAQQGRYCQVFAADAKKGLPFDLEVPAGRKPPKVLFRQPFIVEVVGAGFERPANTDHYMLRHPRVKKIHNNDRDLEHIVSFEQLQQLAKEAAKVPEDVQTEEIRIMERVQKVCKPKRSEYIDQVSPARTLASTTVSPGSTKSPHTTRGTVVRMDSCEMRPGDDRFVSPLAPKTNNCRARSQQSALTETDRSNRQETGSPLKKTKPRGAAHANAVANGSTPSSIRGSSFQRITTSPGIPSTDPTLSSREPAQVRKRKPEPLKDISPPKKRAIERSQSDGVLHTKDRQPQPATISSPLGGDILMTSQPDSFFRSSSPTLFGTPLGTGPMNSQLEDNEVGRTAGAREDAQSGALAEVDLYTLLGTEPLPNALRTNSPLSECTILLSDDLSSSGYVGNGLLSLFNADQTSHMDHWRRDRRPFGGKKGRIVEESQADRGLSKVIVVDTRMQQDAVAFMKAAMSIRLGVGETIDVLDWQALERFVELDKLIATSMLDYEAFKARVSHVKQYYLGTIKMASQTATDAIKEMGLEKAREDEPDLKEAKFACKTDEEDGAGPLINILKHPCRGAAAGMLRSWVEEVTASKFGDKL